MENISKAVENVHGFRHTVIWCTIIFVMGLEMFPQGGIVATKGFVIGQFNDCNNSDGDISQGWHAAEKLSKMCIVVGHQRPSPSSIASPSAVFMQCFMLSALLTTAFSRLTSKSG